LAKKNIVVLAAGPPKVNRNRHLENISNGNILIDEVIERSSVDGITMHIVVNSSNLELISHMADNYPDIEIIKPSENTIYGTFSAALSILGDCIMICGDLVNLKKGDIKKFVGSEYKSAICRYLHPWGQNMVSAHGTIRRADIGDCISLISQDHKALFLSEENYIRASSYHAEFYPNRKIDPYIYNDIGTHMMYSFFKEICSVPGVMSHEDRGTVFFDYRVYEDND